MKTKHLLLVGGLLMPVQLSMAQVADAITEVKPAKVAEFADLTVAEVQAELKKGAVTVIDATAEESYKAGHVPGAVHFAAIKGDAMAAALPEDKAALIVTYCGGPT